MPFLSNYSVKLLTSVVWATLSSCQTQCSRALWPFSCSAFPLQLLSFFFILVPLRVDFLFSTFERTVAALALTENDVSCLHTARHLTWPSTFLASCRNVSNTWQQRYRQQKCKLQAAGGDNTQYCQCKYEPNMSKCYSGTEKTYSGMPNTIVIM